MFFKGREGPSLVQSIYYHWLVSLVQPIHHHRLASLVQSIHHRLGAVRCKMKGRARTGESWCRVRMWVPSLYLMSSGSMGRRRCGGSGLVIVNFVF